MKFGIDLRHHSFLSHPYFEKKQRIGTKVSHLMQRGWNSVIRKYGAVWFTPL